MSPSKDTIEIAPRPPALLRVAVLAILACAAALLALACEAAPAGAAKRGYVVHRDVDYNLGAPLLPPSTPAMNRLDIYQPRDAALGSARPVVVWIHGGGWRRGDKRLAVRKKADLFTRAGYLFVSVNYRLSAAPFDPLRPDPFRVKFPAQPRDVGEAIGWLDANIAEYGGDRRRLVLIGHSAGAHLASLVATDPSYVRRYDVRARQLIGFVSLDTPAFDIAAGADPGRSRRPEEGREMLWNAFATPGENSVTGAWAAASPVEFAGPNDPPSLLVTQARNPQRRVDHRAMARALGRDPQRTILPLPLTHGEIGRMLGDRGDLYGETGAVMRFVRHAVAAARGPAVLLDAHPPRRLRALGRAARVEFAFSSTDRRARFECRLDDARFERCRSPLGYRVAAGEHRFAVRALGRRAAAGPPESFRFRVFSPRG